MKFCQTVPYGLRMTKHKKKEGPRNTDPGIPNVPGAVDFAVQGAPEYMFGATIARILTQK